MRGESRASIKSSFIAVSASPSLALAFVIRIGGQKWLGFTVVADIEIDRSNRLRRFKERLRTHSNTGSALIEFAVIAPVFFLLLFAILEIGIIYFAQSQIQYGTNDIARFVRTGQSTGVTQDQVRQRVCNDIAPLIPCDGDLSVDIEAFPTFAGVNFSNPLGPTGSMNSMNNYQPGTACTVVLVRVFYAWPVFTPFLTPFLSNMAGSKHLLYSAAAFRNEPYALGLAGC
jgi:Flp pilus assembly protein TadG